MKTETFASLMLVCSATAIVATGGRIVGCQAAPAFSAADVAVYGALVEAGCLAADDAGVAYVAQEHALPNQEPWLGCMYEGGSPASCGVPCSNDSDGGVP